MQRLLQSFVVAALLIIPAGCAAHRAEGERTPAAGSHEGVYDFRAESEGLPPLTGTITVRRGSEGYTGAIATEVFPPIALTSVREQDGLLTLIGRTAEGEVTFRIRFTGADFEGEWRTSDGLGGRATGTRRPLN